MKNELTEKEQLLSMLFEIYDQLEELEDVLETSFSDQRKSLNNEVLKKINRPKQRLSILEDKFIKRPEIHLADVKPILKIELGY